MNLINTTINKSVMLGVEGKINYAPDKSCFDWCSIQQVVHSNNLELSAILMVVFAYIFIVLYNIADEIKIIKPFRETFIYWAKLLLIMFLGFYVLIIRMRLIW